MMDKVLLEMARVYGMFCMPEIIIDTNTGAFEYKTKWTYPEAEEYYNTLQKLLSYLDRKNWR